jgi:putative nucleotidyltransferase with HDIG domain
MLRHAPDVALIDLNMPVLDGIGTIRALRASGLQTRALVLTAKNDREAIAEAIEAGADGYVLKGCSAQEIRDAVRTVGYGGAVLAPTVARSVLDDYVALMEERRARDIALIRTLANAVECRDETTGRHASNVARLSLELLREMTQSEPNQDLVYGFLLHDVGKIGIPDRILLKPAALTMEEFEEMKRHVEIGAGLVEPLGFREIVLDIIRCHHERWDGGGYPRRLRGEEIPFEARIFSVVDSFDAMTSDRPYRKGMATDQALEELLRVAGAQLDPSCVDAFVGLSADLLAPER